MQALGGVVLLVATAVALAPASLLDRPLAQRTNDRARLADAEGVWWHGRGMLVSADGTARMPIQWRVDVASLLTGTLAVRLSDGAQPEPSGTIVLRRDHVEIRDLRVRLPAALVAAADPRLGTFALGGRIALDAPSFVSTGNARTGTANATWNDARIALSGTTFNLGTVSVAFVPAGGGTTATIRNVGGDLALDGTVRDQMDAFDVELVIRPTSSASAQVRDALPLLGTPDGAGGVRVAWRG